MTEQNEKLNGSHIVPSGAGQLENNIRRLEGEVRSLKAQYEMEIERFGLVLNDLAGDMSKLRKALTTFVEGRKE